MHEYNAEYSLHMQAAHFSVFCTLFSVEKKIVETGDEDTLFQWFPIKMYQCFNNNMLRIQYKYWKMRVRGGYELTGHSVMARRS